MPSPPARLGGGRQGGPRRGPGMAGRRRVDRGPGRAPRADAEAAAGWPASCPAVSRAVLISSDLSSLPPHSPRSSSALRGSNAMPPSTLTALSRPSTWPTWASARLNPR